MSNLIKENKYAIFEYEERDRNIIDDLISYVDEHAKEIYEFFGVKFSNKKVKYRIIPTKKEYDDEYRKVHNLSEDVKIPNWNIGCFYGENIILLSFNDYQNVESHKHQTFEYYKKTVMHEFVHFVNNLFVHLKNCSNTDRFLAEGIACYLSKQREGKNVKLSCTLDELLDKTKPLSYDNYYILTKYLVENYDREFVLKLFQSSRQTREFLQNELYDKVSKSCFGIDNNLK